jgi:UDP-N-acetylglucosamine 2-epimerase (non-hydrolysing)/GDP/UDP-N,N'-diacetylbacillosamine 2-epimerase (hydrolysing)
VLVLLGDRYEMLSVAQAALVARIPIVHIHGGEVTEGAVDDSIRHAITKMAHVHFAATEPFRRRVIQLGEHPKRVFNVGAPGLDYLRHLECMSREDLESSLDFEFGNPTFLITYHPATLQERPSEESINELLEALDEFPNARLIFTKANADAEGRKINQRIERYVLEESDRAELYSSLGQQRYLSALHHVDLVLGNSSSGLTEAPAIPVPTVNLGTRQDGRPRAKSVIDCREQADDIAESIRKALSDSFRNQLEDASSPYGDGKATPRICRHLKVISLENLTTKSFYDLNVEELSTASVQEQHT